jgi:hypothetical protein
MGSNPGVGEARSRVTGGALALGAAGQGGGAGSRASLCRLPAGVSSSDVRPPARTGRERGGEEEGGMARRAQRQAHITGVHLFGDRVGRLGCGDGTARAHLAATGAGGFGRVGSCAVALCCGKRKEKEREGRRAERLLWRLLVDVSTW